MLGAPEMWAGVECTVSRVGDQYSDQLERNGHARRLGDLELFADLGVSAMRYPILWERTAPDGLERADWSWADERLGRLRELGIRPIVGLLHHGSGPPDTSLVDPDFPDKLACFARAVAERYAWVDAYTPINEPLTTARFSGLYGHWYPHGRDDQTFARALLNQCRGTILAMQAIREVRRDAQLVQTEDLGKTWSTPLLASQATFENDRRWLSFDLLGGWIDRRHPLWQYLRMSGVDEGELDWVREQACPPDLIGINYYLTSERFLDERIERYPGWTHGGNRYFAYADVETVRVSADLPPELYRLLREVWERYRLPMAVTEAHLSANREEQLRWLWETWQTARRLRREGVDMRAVTAWALLGSFDWNSLLTRLDDHYESGVFDVRGQSPRPTALAWLIRELAAGREPDHPILAAPGWWRRPSRLLYPPVRCLAGGVDAPPLGPGAVSDNVGAELTPVGSVGSVGSVGPVDSAPSAGDDTPGAGHGAAAQRPPVRAIRQIAITGARGTLGRAVARVSDDCALAHRALTRAELDIADPGSIDALLDDLRPWAVVNAAGYVRVDDAEREPDACERENALGPTLLATACARRGVRLVTFSSDLVFDGAKRAPYVESDAVAPLNAYGRSKVAGEARVLDAYPAALVIRTSAFFGPIDQYNFVTVALRELAAGRPFVAADDQVVSPTYVPDLVRASLDLLIDGAHGIWHLATPGAVSWAELARRAAELAGLDPAGVVACPTAELHLAAPRPRYSALASEHGALLPPLDRALERYFLQRAEALATT